MHSDNDQPSSSDQPDRKSSKPLMEKRRRARINSSLAELKTLLMDVIRREGACHSKMEKADILEMTVRHLRQITGSSCTDPTTGSKHKLGFVECTQEVSRFLSRVEGCDVELRTKLLDHLANVASGSERHERASSMSSLPFQSTNPNRPVLLTNFPMQEQPRQIPLVTESAPHKIDLQPSLQTSGIQSNIMSGLHVIPTQLRSGEIAFVLPTQIAEIPKSSSVVIPLMNTVTPTLTLSTEGASSGQTKDVPKLYRNIRVKSETVSSPPKSPLPKSSPGSVYSASFGIVRNEPAISSSSCFSTPSDSVSRISNISCISQPLPSDEIKGTVSFKSQGNILSVEHTKHYSQPKFQDGVKEKDINIIPTFSDISQMHRKEKYGSDLQTGLEDDTPTSTNAEGSFATDRFINFEKSPISAQQPKTIFTPQIVIPQSDRGLDLRLSGRTVETLPIISKYDGIESHPFSFALHHERTHENSDKGTVGNLSAGCSSRNANVVSHTQQNNSKRDENDNNFNPDSQSDRDENDNNINENANENQETGMWRPW